MAKVVARWSVRMKDGTATFERWDDGTILRTVGPESAPGFGTDSTFARAERVLALRQLKAGESPWFPGRVLSRVEAAAVLGVGANARGTDVEQAFAARSQLYDEARIAPGSDTEREAARAARAQLDEARTVLLHRAPEPQRPHVTRPQPAAGDTPPQRPTQFTAPSAPGATQYMLTAARSFAQKELLKAGLWLGGGLILTGVTYSAASGGGAYVVFWGAIVYGAIKLVRALYFLANPAALVRRAGDR